MTNYRINQIETLFEKKRYFKHFCILLNVGDGTYVPAQNKTYPYHFSTLKEDKPRNRTS